MIPEKLRLLVEQQAGDVRRGNPDLAREALVELGVPLDSEFSQFYLSYRVTFFISNVSSEELCDVAEPSSEVMAGTRFVHDMWGIPEGFICFTTVEGEGGYLYEVESGKVWDFDLAEISSFVSGKACPRWDGFFEFLIWYLE